MHFQSTWCYAMLSHFSRVRLCVTPIDSSPPGSAVPGIPQARTLEWVAISFSNAWKWKVKVKLLSHVQLPVTPWTAAHQAPLSMGFSRQEYWSGVPFYTLMCYLFSVCVLYIVMAIFYVLLQFLKYKIHNRVKLEFWSFLPAGDIY